MERVEASQVALLREVLGATDWLERTDDFARALHERARTPGGLLLLGNPVEEPWHLAAHLDEESRFNDVPGLAPTLVRWVPPPAGPAHLSIGLDRLRETARGETLLVVTPQTAPVPLLERVDDARRRGAAILALDRGDDELRRLAHDELAVAPEEQLLTFDGAQHLVSYAATAPPPARSRPGLRERLARLLETVSGPSDAG